MFDVVIVPQGAESKAVAKAIAQTTANPKLVKIPIGTQNTTATLEQQKFWQESPKKVLMLGLCGSLSPDLAVGEAVLYQSCQNLTTKAQLTLQPELNSAIQQKLALKLVNGLTSDRIITTVSEKQQLAQKYHCEAIDMENYAYLKFLQEQQIQLAIIRVISDDLTFDLPDLNSAIAPTGQIKPLAMTTALLQNPLNSTRFVKNSLQALKQLEKITYQIFNQLPTANHLAPV